MNPTRIIILTCTLAAVGLAVGVTVERQARLKLDAENNVLREQLSKMRELTAENQRLSNLLLQTNSRSASGAAATNSIAASGGDRAELERLREEIEQFSQRSNQVETLRADTVATATALKEAHDAHLTERPIHHANASAGTSSFEVLSANYGTESTNLDVAAELNDRIINGGLKMIANNNMAGDPDYGKVKSLTVIYRSGGRLMTNQFRENDIINLPPP